MKPCIICGKDVLAHQFATVYHGVLLHSDCVGTLIDWLKGLLAMLEGAMEEDDSAACTQMEWEAEPLPQIRKFLARSQAGE